MTEARVRGWLYKKPRTTMPVIMAVSLLLATYVIAAIVVFARKIRRADRWILWAKLRLALVGTGLGILPVAVGAVARQIDALTDKRVDVIATAMAMGANVRDLARLDLAYAPPFGAAKDPVHLAAFAACNQLDVVEIMNILTLGTITKALMVAGQTQDVIDFK